MTAPIEHGVIRLPSWFTAIAISVLAMAGSWAGWISIQLISTRNELVELRAQVRSNAVSEGTEKALNEIRARMNAELAGRDALAKLAVENAKDIAYASKEIESLKQIIREKRP